MKPNLCVYYLYRDADNYKRHGQRILGNPTGVTPAQLRVFFAKGFLSIQLFPDVVSIDPVRLGWEPLYFSAHNLSANDVSVHELEGIEETNEAPAVGEFVAVLMARLENLCGPN